MIAAFLEGPAQLVLWVVALTVDYASALMGRGRGWHVSPAHFVERHGLIIIIALGESIVSIGVGAAGLPLDVPGSPRPCSGWSSRGPLVGVLRLGDLRLAGPDRRGDRAERADSARDLFSYLHMPMVFGIVLFASA